MVLEFYKKTPGVAYSSHTPVRVWSSAFGLPLELDSSDEPHGVQPLGCPESDSSDEPHEFSL